MNRVREFGAGVLAVRASMTGVEGLRSRLPQLAADRTLSRRQQRGFVTFAVVFVVGLLVVTTLSLVERRAVTAADAIDDPRYHELRTVFQTIELHDTLTFVERPGPFVLCATGTALTLYAVRADC